MNTIFAQLNNPYVRIAKIVIDSSQLDGYKMAVKEHAQAAVKAEPGVIALYAVYDKDQPTHVTVFEIYADKNAYEQHIQTSHFKKYKSSTLNMVKSLQLTDVIPIALQEKTGKLN
ncbi:MAG TPA: putative quinol monooxygenase [Flavisolibacter sp.]|jgi:quinol monooxygenase YgiN|nr:putative quinol monooxygenase [Flavisolibacter sp.]